MAGRTVHCAGKTYHGPFIENLRNPGSGTFSIVGWGVAAFKTTLTIAVFTQAGIGSSPPICASDTGTYRFVSGPLRGKHGTFTALATGVLTAQVKDTLVFHQRPPTVYGTSRLGVVDLPQSLRTEAAWLAAFRLSPIARARAAITRLPLRS